MFNYDKVGMYPIPKNWNRLNEINDEINKENIVISSIQSPITELRNKIKGKKEIIKIKETELLNTENKLFRAKYGIEISTIKAKIEKIKTDIEKRQKDTDLIKTENELSEIQNKVEKIKNKFYQKYENEVNKLGANFEKQGYLIFMNWDSREKNFIKNALKTDKYINWIKANELTVNESIEIIKSAGLELPEYLKTANTKQRALALLKLGKGKMLMTGRTHK